MADSLGDRMKFYEQQTRQLLLPQLPMIVRINGKSFSKWTQGLKRPWDERLTKTFINTTESVMRDIATESILAFGQSDEVTFVFPRCINGVQPFYGGKHDKICSIMASTFTVAFNAIAKINGLERPGAIFDARVFSVASDEEVVNNLIWRQQDATRNSIQMLGHTHFKHQDLHKKNDSQIQELLRQHHGINWNDQPIHLKRGWCVRRITKLVPTDKMLDVPEKFRPQEPVARRLIEPDMGIPIFTKDRNYILDLIGRD